ncbi:MAG TPA: hypothetical protein VMF89_30555, partial [Polyangiales bacterium]|nr:hypothetical protein [Polyangiales bacterium]
LDHNALERGAWLKLVTELYRVTRKRHLLGCMASQYGFIHADLANTAPSLLLPEGTRALLLASENERFWEARWLFPLLPAKLDVTEPVALFDALLAGGLRLGSSDAPFKPQDAEHLAFPDIPGSQRHTCLVRVDTQMLIALNADGVVAIRIVRTK